MFVADVTRARTVLGWEPQVTVRQGLDTLLDWLGEHRHEVAEIVGSRRLDAVATTD